MTPHWLKPRWPHTALARGGMALAGLLIVTNRTPVQVQVRNAQPIQVDMDPQAPVQVNVGL